MANQLLIQPKDIIAFTPIENVADDRLIPMIALAQEKYIRNDLGKRLYDEIIAGLTANTETANNRILRVDYIKPALIWLALVEFVQYNRFRIDDKGSYIVSAENSSAMDDKQTQKYIREVRINAQTYVEQLIDYLCYNSTLYPNYYRTTDGGPYPSFRAFDGGWYL